MDNITADRRPAEAPAPRDSVPAVSYPQPDPSGDEQLAHDATALLQGLVRARTVNPPGDEADAQGWLASFEAHRSELTALVGEEVVRVWRLYLVGGALAFRDGRMGVDQILCVRPGAPHTLPPERAW